MSDWSPPKEYYLCQVHKCIKYNSSTFSNSLKNDTRTEKWQKILRMTTENLSLSDTEMQHDNSLDQGILLPFYLESWKTDLIIRKEIWLTEARKTFAAAIKSSVFPPVQDPMYTLSIFTSLHSLAKARLSGEWGYKST